MAMYDIKIDFMTKSRDTQAYTVEADTEDEAVSEATRRLYRDFEDDNTTITKIENTKTTLRPLDKYYYISVCVVDKKSEVIEINHYFDFYVTKRWNTSEDNFAIRLQKEIEWRAGIYAEQHHISNYETKEHEIEEVSEKEYCYCMSYTI